MKFEKTEQIYNMDLHSMLTIYCGQLVWYVTRVHGGWIYTALNGNGAALSSTFVPYD